jgi:thiamine pyrophosphate-dependent acetolactate synthase large subunit-like protein
VGDRPSQAEFGSDYVVELMRALGIRYASFNPGATFRGIHDSLVNFQGGSGIEVVECTHEEISVAVAHGYAKASGKPIAAIVHDVVGLQHASMAIFNAWVDRVPIFVLGATGPMDSTRRRPRIDWMHTANVQGNLVRDFVKFDDQPASIPAVPESMLRAWRTMLTEPQGPVYVCFDAEVQEGRAPEGLVVPDVSKLVQTTRIGPDPVAIELLARELLAAQTPVILTGLLGRNPEAVPALVELAELLGCPVLASDERLSFPTTHPLNLSGADKQVLAESDFVLALDVWDLQGRVTQLNRSTRVSQPIMRPGARVATINLADLIVRSWSHDFQALYPADLSIVADTALALPLLAEAIRRQAGSSQKQVAEQRGAAARERHLAMRASWRAQASGEHGSRPVSVAYLSSLVGEKVKNRDWMLAYHSFNPWPLRLWDFDNARQYASASGGAGVGYGIGGTIGVALAHRGDGKIIVDLQADGDLLYCTSALWTIAQQKLPILMVMQNNRSYYNSEEHAISMAEYRGRPIERAGVGTHIRNPEVDFSTVARGFGIHAEGPITDPADLGPAIDRALEIVTEEGVAALVDVVTAPR